MRKGDRGKRRGVGKEGGSRRRLREEKSVRNKIESQSQREGERKERQRKRQTDRLARKKEKGEKSVSSGLPPLSPSPPTAGPDLLETKRGFDYLYNAAEEATPLIIPTTRMQVSG